MQRLPHSTPRAVQAPPPRIHHNPRPYWAKSHPKEVLMNQGTFITPERLRMFFHPRSIALVGATDRSRWSIYTHQNLKVFGFPGPIYCVNPNYETVHGEPAVKRLSDIREAV